MYVCRLAPVVMNVYCHTTCTEDMRYCNRSRMILPFMYYVCTYVRMYVCTYVCMYVCMHNYNALKAATVVVFVHCALYTSQDYVRMYVSSPVYSQTPDLPCLLHPPPYLLALFVGAAAVPSSPAEAGRAHVPLLHDTGK